MEHAANTRTRHELKLPRSLHTPGSDPVRHGLYVDCETTGMDWSRDDVIEVGLLPFTYTEDGRIVEVLHDQARSDRRDPGRSLSAEITGLTGLTDEDVRGRHIHIAAADALIERADLIIAHNARFDRPFFERVLPATRAKPWACSRLEVPWLAAGCPSTALHCLLCHYGVFARDRHRALADCEAGVWLLAANLPGTERPVLGALRERALTPTQRLWAVGAPIGVKDELRARGYRWMPERDHTRGIPRAWWTEVAPEMLESELAWLEEVCEAHTRAHGGPGFSRRDTVVRTVTAYDRWRANPADIALPPRAIRGIPN